MKIKISKRVNPFKIFKIIYERRKTYRLLRHIETLSINTIIENNKNISFISDDGFETQLSKDSIWYGDKAQSKQSKAILKLGKATYLQDCKIGPFWDNRSVEIGSFCSFGPGVDIRLDGVRGKSQFTSYPLELIDPESKIVKTSKDSLKTLSVKIGNDVFIGENTKIMSNVTIGDGVIVGARSIITSNKILESYAIYAGSPARFIKYRFEEDIVKELLKLKWWKYDKQSICKMGLQHIDFEKDKVCALKRLRKLNEKYKIN